jgi:hypothetical protein
MKPLVKEAPSGVVYPCKPRVGEARPGAAVTEFRTDFSGSILDETVGFLNVDHFQVVYL